MTAEWIDGVRMSDKPGVQKLMGEGQDGSQPTELKTPEGPKLVHPLNGGRKWVGTTMVDLFCAQIFDWGWLHCDPHPGKAGSIHSF
jgi:aarF domain-containing kinase